MKENSLVSRFCLNKTYLTYFTGLVGGSLLLLIVIGCLCLRRRRRFSKQRGLKPMNSRMGGTNLYSQHGDRLSITESEDTRRFQFPLAGNYKIDHAYINIC